jgi:hypothetical protein
MVEAVEVAAVVVVTREQAEQVVVVLDHLLLQHPEPMEPTG